MRTETMKLRELSIRYAVREDADGQTPPQPEGSSATRASQNGSANANGSSLIILLHSPAPMSWSPRSIRCHSAP